MNIADTWDLESIFAGGSTSAEFQGFVASLERDVANASDQVRDLDDMRVCVFQTGHPVSGARGYHRSAAMISAEYSCAGLFDLACGGFMAIKCLRGHLE